MPSRRFNRTNWPDVGPHRDLLDFLDDVHVRFGCRSLRQIGDAMHLAWTRVYDIVRGTSLPVDEKQVRSLVLALAGQESAETAAMADDAVELFGKALRARNEARPATEPEPEIIAGPDSADAPLIAAPTHRRRLAAWGTAGVAVVAVVAALGFFTVGGASGSDGTGDAGALTATAVPAPDAGPATAACPIVADGNGTVQPTVTSNGAEYGVTFCPVRINGGRLPITGPFELSGMIEGPLDKRQQIVLINHGVAGSCDALGSPPALGGFLAQTAFDAPDEEWSFTDRLGYDEAVTLARHYEFIAASSASIVTIEADRQIWAARHVGAEDDYPGILTLPVDARVLASFDVPAGTYPGAKPCRTS